MFSKIKKIGVMTGHERKRIEVFKSGNVIPVVAFTMSIACFESREKKSRVS